MESAVRSRVRVIRAKILIVIVIVIRGSPSADYITRCASVLLCFLMLIVIVIVTVTVIVIVIINECQQHTL